MGKVEIYFQLLTYFKVCALEKSSLVEQLKYVKRIANNLIIGRTGLEALQLSCILNIPMTKVFADASEEVHHELEKEAYKCIQPPALADGIRDTNNDFHGYTWSCVDKTTSGKDESFHAKSGEVVFWDFVL